MPTAQGHCAEQAWMRGGCGDALVLWEVPGSDWSLAGRCFLGGYKFRGSAQAAYLHLYLVVFLLNKAICLLLRHCCSFTGLKVAFTIESASFSGESKLPSLKKLWLLNDCPAEQRC